MCACSALHTGALSCRPQCCLHHRPPSHPNATQLVSLYRCTQDNNPLGSPLIWVAAAPDARCRVCLICGLPDELLLLCGCGCAVSAGGAGRYLEQPHISLEAVLLRSNLCTGGTASQGQDCPETESVASGPSTLPPHPLPLFQSWTLLVLTSTTLMCLGGQRSVRTPPRHRSDRTKSVCFVFVFTRPHQGVFQDARFRGSGVFVVGGGPHTTPCREQTSLSCRGHKDAEPAVCSPAGHGWECGGCVVPGLRYGVRQRRRNASRQRVLPCVWRGEHQRQRVQVGHPFGWFSDVLGHLGYE